MDGIILGTVSETGGKAPCKPENLRPINLLPAEAKLLAKIAAHRLRPYITQAVKGIPQFAYATARQTSDALDRVLSHCAKIRTSLKDHHRSVFRTQAGIKRASLAGGLQVSLDMSKAFDRLPRRLLRAALERVRAPESLIRLVLYIHDAARIVIDRHSCRAEVALGTGVRQGCGLSPLLWVAFTILAHDTISTYIPTDSQTYYADDFHFAWELSCARDLRQACQLLPRLLADLEHMGMNVSLNKSVALLAIKGTEAEKLLKEFTMIRQGVRVLRVRHAAGLFTLPLRRVHDYLGVKIGYATFELATVQHRMTLSWTAFHRLHSLLKHPLIPLRKRVLLWKSCVWSVLSYGLPATGLDPNSAQQLVSGVMRQLRSVARSPAHISHLTNTDILNRLEAPHPLQWMTDRSTARLAACKRDVSHVQPERVQQWWAAVHSSFQITQLRALGSGVLTEVTQVLRIHCSCSVCGQSFPSTHALKVHMGKKHPQSQTAHDPNPTIKNKQHALGGPQCRHCLKRFSAWPQSMGHINQQACPILHHPKLQAKHESTHSPPEHDASTQVASTRETSTQLRNSPAEDNKPPPLDIPAVESLAEPDPVPTFTLVLCKLPPKQATYR